MHLIRKHHFFPISFCSRICRGLYFVLLLSSFLPAAAQEIFIGPQARLISSFPFTTFNGGVVVFQAQLEGYPDTLNFILDTGSGGISLDSSTCVRLKLEPLLSDKVVLGIGGIRRVKFVYNRRFRIGSLVLDSMNFHVSDYDMLSSVYGNKIDGIMGYSFFSRYIVKIDYDSNLVSVYSKGRMKYPAQGYLFKPQLVSLPVQNAVLKDDITSSSRFYFDTGAGLCLLVSDDFVHDSLLFNAKKKTFATQAQGLGGKANMRITTLKDFRMGPYRFRNVPIHTFDDEYKVTSYPSLAGLIGNDILRRFNIILNYEKKEFFLRPNSHFNDPFDYSYTGLGLYWLDGEIRVGDIMKDSPAEKAGFKIDDVVIGIDKNFTKNLDTYKTMLQNPGQKIRFTIKRADEIGEITLKVKSIL